MILDVDSAAAAGVPVRRQVRIGARVNTRAIFEDGRREAGAEPWMNAFHQLELLPPHASVMTLL